MRRLSLAAICLAAGLTPGAKAEDLITSVSLNDLKAIFDAAGVPYLVKTVPAGWSYISGNAGGEPIYVYAMDCADPPTQTGCKVVGIETEKFDVAITDTLANVFNSNAFPIANAVIYKDYAPYPVLEYSFRISAGVAPGYIRSELRAFVSDIADFRKFLAGLKAPGITQSSIAPADKLILPGQRRAPETQRGAAAGSPF